MINFPQYAVLAGKVGGKNSGGHGGRPLVNSTGSRSASPCAAARRRSRPPASTSNPTKGPQLQPPANFQLNYPRQSALEDPDALQALEDVARANGTYYAGCPANPNGKIVVIENAGTAGTRTARRRRPAPAKCCNTLANPGPPASSSSGKVDFGGNIEFWGVVWNANLDNSTRPRHDRDVRYGRHPRRRARGRPRRRLCRLRRQQHRLLRARVREHQRGRHRRRRSEHLARDRQPADSRSGR